MRRKRRNRGTWFPILGTSGEAPIGSPLPTYYTAFTDVLADYSPSLVDVTPLIPDETSDPNLNIAGQGTTLRDYVEGQTCLVERIVGKIVCNAEQVPGSGGGTGNHPHVIMIACAAIAVLPVNDAGGVDIPEVEYAPLLAANADKPYMWRRTWVLGNNAPMPDSVGPDFTAPSCNEFFASAYDGPHIDTKGSKRNIQRNQRIFLLLQSVGIQPGEPLEDSTVFWTVDLRCYGQLRRARNKSLFT